MTNGDDGRPRNNGPTPDRVQLRVIVNWRAMTRSRRRCSIAEHNRYQYQHGGHTNDVRPRI